MEENYCWYWSILEIQLPHLCCYTWCGPDSSEKRWSPSRCRIASTIVSRFCFPAPGTDHLSNILTQRYSYDDCTMNNYKNIVIQCYSYDCTHWCCRTSESQCIAGSLQSQGPWGKRFWKFSITQYICYGCFWSFMVLSKSVTQFYNTGSCGLFVLQIPGRKEQIRV